MKSGGGGCVKNRSLTELTPDFKKETKREKETKTKLVNLFVLTMVHCEPKKERKSGGGEKE